MKNGGAVINKIELFSFSEDNKGIQATENIKKGEEILFVPENLLLTAEAVATSLFGSDVIEQFL